MCGRFAITASAELIAETFDAVWQSTGLDRAAGPAEAAHEPSLPRYNMAPTQFAPVIRMVTPARRIASFMRWGLVPSWADDPSIGNRLINARAETAASKPSFRTAWRRRRCLVPATHFYEWKKSGAVKQPMAICAASESAPLLALAGLWESWRDELESFTILTTAPNALLRTIHDRMPVILRPERWTQWLDSAWSGPENDEELAEWIAPAPDDTLRAFSVSAFVNSPRNESPACLEPQSL